MHVIFLDIDGVLKEYPIDVPSENSLRVAGCLINIDILDMFRDFVEKHDIVIVGVSSWFLDTDYKVLADALNLPIIGRSENCMFHRDIGAEKWIVENNPDADYIFVDDRNDMYKNNQHPNLVEIDSYTGITPSKIAEMALKLNL